MCAGYYTAIVFERYLKLGFKEMFLQLGFENVCMEMAPVTTRMYGSHTKVSYLTGCRLVQYFKIHLFSGLANP